MEYGILKLVYVERRSDTLPLRVPEERLESKLREIYNRHMVQTKKVDWSYHALLPWEKGRSFISEPWRPEQANLSPELYMAIETALLTEINLPWFTKFLTEHTRGGHEILQNFIYTWVAEEAQHADLLEVYLLLNRSTNPDSLHEIRKEVLTLGANEPDLDSAFEVMVYTSIQELATRSFYLNVAQAGEKEDKIIATILRQLAKDETLHYAFYRDAVKAYLDCNPNYAWPLARVVIEFQMPGANMPGYEERMRTIAKEVGYGPAQYYRQVIGALVDYWDLPNLHPTYSGAQKAIDDLKAYARRLERIAARFSKDDGKGYGGTREKSRDQILTEDSATLKIVRNAMRSDD